MQPVVPQLPADLWMDILLRLYRDWEIEWLNSLSDCEWDMYGGQSPVAPEEMAEVEYERNFGEYFSGDIWPYPLT